jgi:predicted acylesterase/phospholipase RssA
VGGLRALDDYLVERRMVDFDLYVGLSVGSMLAVPLAAGISPDEMIKVLEGTSQRFAQLSPFHFYSPNLREWVDRPTRLAWELLAYLPGLASDAARRLPRLPEALGPAIRKLFRDPGYTALEELAMAVFEQAAPERELPSPLDHLPSGIFDNATLERWLRENLARIGMPNDFRELRAKRNRGLYVTACDLDTAERVIFGPDEQHHVTISEAVQASTALPIFYKPARLAGVDYVDGGIRNTANIDVAIEKGADLIVCYNPFRPFVNRIDAEGVGRFFASGRYLSDLGLRAVINQVFRTLLHSRLTIAVQRYLADDRFRGDIVLLEPREQDAEFFAINPLAFWRRADAIRSGFESVRRTIDQNFDALSEVLPAYGFAMDRKVAARRASRLRSSHGWRVSAREDGPEEMPHLRAVGT